MFNGAFPQVLASLLVPQSEHEGVFLFLPLIIVLNNDQGELLLLEVQLGDLGPEEEPYFCFSLEHQDSGWRETQTIL